MHMPNVYIESRHKVSKTSILNERIDKSNSTSIEAITSKVKHTHTVAVIDVYFESCPTLVTQNFYD